MGEIELHTPRLRLRGWRSTDLRGFAALNADPEVMRYLSGRPETLDETVAVVARVQRRWAETGFSWWAFIDRASGDIVGAGAVQHLRRQPAPEGGGGLPPGLDG